jgi:hypothetical protein
LHFRNCLKCYIWKKIELIFYEGNKWTLTLVLIDVYISLLILFTKKIFSTFFHRPNGWCIGLCLHFFCRLKHFQMYSCHGKYEIKFNLDYKRENFNYYEYNDTLLSSLLCQFIKTFQVYSGFVSRSRCGRDRMAVGFTNTCTISAYHH